MSSFTAGNAVIDFTARDAKFQAVTNRVQATAERLQQRLAGVSRAARNMLLAGGAGAAVLVKFASDAEEAENRFQAVFKDQAGAAAAAAEELGQRVNRSALDIKSAMSTYQGFFVGLGFGAGEARGLSQQVSQLALDLASFNNISDEDAVGKLIAALSGSGEVLDQYGINIKEAALHQELLRMGIEKGSKAASEQQKTVARLNIIMKGMTDQGAVGDAERTAGSFANQLKGLISSGRELAIAIGQAIIPAALQAVQAARENIGPMIEWARGNSAVIMTGLKVAAALAAILAVAPRVAATVAAVTAAVKAARGAFLALTTAGTGLGVIVAGLAAGALVALVLAIREIVKASRHGAAELRRMEDAASDLGGAVKALNATRLGKGMAETADERISRLRERQRAMQDLLRTVSSLDASAPINLDRIGNRTGGLEKIENWLHPEQAALEQRVRELMLALNMKPTGVIAASELVQRIRDDLGLIAHELEVLDQDLGGEKGAAAQRSRELSELQRQIENIDATPAERQLNQLRQAREALMVKIADAMRAGDLGEDEARQMMLRVADAFDRAISDLDLPGNPLVELFQDGKTAATNFFASVQKMARETVAAYRQRATDLRDRIFAFTADEDVQRARAIDEEYQQLVRDLKQQAALTGADVSKDLDRLKQSRDEKLAGLVPDQEEPDGDQGRPDSGFRSSITTAQDLYRQIQTAAASRTPEQDIKKNTKQTAEESKNIRRKIDEGNRLAIRGNALLERIEKGIGGPAVFGP